MEKTVATLDARTVQLAQRECQVVCFCDACFSDRQSRLYDSTTLRLYGSISAMRLDLRLGPGL